MNCPPSATETGTLSSTYSSISTHHTAWLTSGDLIACGFPAARTSAQFDLALNLGVDR